MSGAHSSPRQKTELDLVIEREKVKQSLTAEITKTRTKLWKTAHAAVGELRRTKDLEREKTEIVHGLNMH